MYTGLVCARYVHVCVHIRLCIRPLYYVFIIIILYKFVDVCTHFKFLQNTFIYIYIYI